MQMSTLTKVIAASAVGLLFAGCSSTQTPVVGGAVDQVGIAVSGGVQDQGANMTLGYRGAKFAVVPVQNEKGELLYLKDGQNKEKTFSVFALLGIDRNSGGQVTAVPAVEQVVAVGQAAEIYAAGRGKLTAEQARMLGLIAQ